MNLVRVPATPFGYAAAESRSPTCKIPVDPRPYSLRSLPRPTRSLRQLQPQRVQTDLTFGGSASIRLGEQGSGEEWRDSGV
jgi:hypothetical protein